MYTVLLFVVEIKIKTYDQWIIVMDLCERITLLSKKKKEKSYDGTQ